MKRHHSGPSQRLGALFLASIAPILAAAFPQKQANEDAAVRASQGTCSDAAQLLNSQWDHVQTDPGKALALLHSEYSCNQRNEARRLALTLREHSGDKLWEQAIFGGGQIASAAGDFETAEDLFKTIQKSYANQAAVNFELANIQLQTGRFGRPQQSYERAAKLEPASAEIQLGLAGARALSGRGETALSGLDQSIQRFPDDPRFLIAYGDVLEQLPEFSEAVFQDRAKRYLERAISIDPASGRAYYLLGQLLIAESKLEEAIRKLELAVQYEPDLRQAHFALSRACRRLGRSSEADEQYSLFRKLEFAQTPVPGSMLGAPAEASQP